MQTENQYVVVKDLKSIWKVLNVETNQLQPFNASNDIHTLYFDLEFSAYKRYSLQLNLPKDHAVYLGGQLVYYVEKGQELNWRIDSLMSVYNSSQIVVSVFSNNLDPNVITSQIVKTQEYIDESDSIFSWSKRGFTNSRNIIILSSLFVLSLVVFFRATSYRLFSEYVSISKSTKVRQRFDLIAAHAPWSPITLSFVLLYAVLIGGSVLNLMLITDVCFANVGGINLSSNPIVLESQVFLISFVLMGLKYPLILFLSKIFNFNKFIEIHFYSYLRFSLLCALGTFGMTIILFVLPVNLIGITWIVFQVILFVLITIRVVLMFLVLNNNYNFRKLHLFSYLCSAEIIPLCIVVKNLLQ
ncbi:MAG: DUF4271 domain-containing protein [Reichenbachiella sp.]